MAAGLPDLVDCARLGSDGAVLEREYALRDLPRLQDLVATPKGTLQARFEFGQSASGRPGAHVGVRATPELMCQRCMQEFSLPMSTGSDVEFAEDADATATDDSRELFPVNAAGLVSLRDLAEEELLLALPLAPACAAPLTCGRAPSAGRNSEEVAAEMRRPFSVLQDLLKKT